MIRRLLRRVAVLALLFLLATAAAVLALRVVDPMTSAVMVREPGPISAIQFDWVDRSQIPEHVAHAAMAAEDQRFLIHAGLDFAALADAIDEYRDGDRLRGASTITQQVAKNLFLWNGRSYARKALEAWFALVVDLAWPKERILEVYLNIAEFGPGVFGVEAAARRFFGCAASELSRSQAAALVAVLPDPKRLAADQPSDYLAERQRSILAQMGLLEERGHYLGLKWRSGRQPAW